MICVYLYDFLGKTLIIIYLPLIGMFAKQFVGEII